VLTPVPSAIERAPGGAVTLYEGLAGVLNGVSQATDGGFIVWGYVLCFLLTLFVQFFFAMNSFSQLLYWLVAGSKGGANRARIIRALKSRPMNAHSLSKHLGVDYKTVKHHLSVLAENQMIVKSGSRYGQVYFVSPQLEDEFKAFEELTKKMEGEK